MAELIIDGDIIAIFPKNQVTDSFAKREFVVETPDEYPQTIKFEFTQAKCDELDKVKVGDSVSVSFNVRGRKWTNKEGKDMYFNTLQAWRMQVVGSSDIPQMTADESPTYGGADTETGELPF
jgi:hypothetical protein